MSKSLPSGWTDDMNIVIPEGRSLDEVVTLVISMGRQGANHEIVEKALVETVGLSQEDVELVDCNR